MEHVSARQIEPRRYVESVEDKIVSGKLFLFELIPELHRLVINVELGKQSVTRDDRIAVTVKRTTLAVSIKRYRRTNKRRLPSWYWIGYPR